MAHLQNICTGLPAHFDWLTHFEKEFKSFETWGPLLNKKIFDNFEFECIYEISYLSLYDVQQEVRVSATT